MTKHQAPTNTNKEQAVNRRQFEGEVATASEAKTIHVVVKRAATHPKYRKQYSIAKRYAVHDEHGKAKVGDRVLFTECRPLSKTKRWRLVKVF